MRFNRVDASRMSLDGVKNKLKGAISIVGDGFKGRWQHNLNAKNND